MTTAESIFSPVSSTVRGEMVYSIWLSVEPGASRNSTRSGTSLTVRTGTVT